MKSNTTWTIVLIAAVLAVSFPAVNGELLNYDDERYITANPWLEFSDERPSESMFTAYFDGHYHPLTLLSLKFDESIGSDSIYAHHLINLLLHVGNALLLFWLVRLLLKDQVSAFAITLLWAIHPVAVESYAWMTERKNVLYTLFFLLSAIQYLKYLRESDKKRLGYTALFFLLSCLSKGQGILLVPVYFLLDYYENGKLFDKSRWIEKVGFAAVALIFAWLGRNAQAEAWNLGDNPYDLGERFILGCYAFVMYIVHTFVPVGLSPYHPYPTEYGAEIGGIYYIGIAGVVAYITALFYTFKKSKLWFFGLSWFAINIVLMLKILQVPFGNYVMADRYAYIAMIGLLIPALHEIVSFLKKSNPKAPIYGTIAIALVFAWFTRTQIGYWQSSMKLWSGVLDHYPDYPNAANMYALGAVAAGENEEAFKAFDRMETIAPESGEGAINRAVLLEQMGRSQEAMSWVKKAMEREPQGEVVLSKAPLFYLRRGKIDEALAQGKLGHDLYPENVEIAMAYARALGGKRQFNQALGVLQNFPNDELAMSLANQIQQLANQGNSAQNPSSDDYMQQAINAARGGNLVQAERLFNLAVESNPNDAAAYANRGSFFAQQGQFMKAEQDLLKSAELNPANGNVFAMLGTLYADMKQEERSCQFYLQAVAKGANISQDILKKCQD
ncbi:MAG: tetratricopeptide repeat protein [Flavobacteriia bacterium]|nr:tetratricopeptide repeat protein [Flavobacteriia bacterium]